MTILIECSTERLQQRFSRPPGCRPYGPEGQDSARVHQRTDQHLAEPRLQRILTVDFHRLSQIRVRTFHRRDAEYAEEIPFAQSGDDDWAKTYSSNLRNIFVCRRLPTNKKLILCASAVSCVSLPSCTSRPSWSNSLSPRRARRSRSFDHCSCQERMGHKFLICLARIKLFDFRFWIEDFRFLGLVHICFGFRYSNLGFYLYLASFASLRLAPWNTLSTEALSFHSRYYSTGLALWNSDHNAGRV